MQHFFHLSILALYLFRCRIRQATLSYGKDEYERKRIEMTMHGIWCPVDEQFMTHNSGICGFH